MNSSSSGDATWLTARDVQDRLKIRRSAAYALIRKLPRLKVGKILRVRAADLEAFVASNMLPGAPGPTALQAERERARRDAELKLLLHASAEARKRNRAKTTQTSEAQPKIRITQQRRSGPLAPSPHAEVVASLSKPTRPRVSAPEPALPPIRLTRQPAKLPY